MVEPVTIRLSLAEADRLRTYLTTHLPEHRRLHEAAQRKALDGRIREVENTLGYLKRQRESLS